MNKESRTYMSCLCLFTAFAFAGWAKLYGQGAEKPLVIAHLCDPQLGFYEDSFSADSARFEQAIRRVNELSPDVTLIAGDMVNDINDEYAVATISKLIAKIRTPVILTPGNHDLPDPVTLDGLKRYRSVFGQDFTVHEYAGRCIISANSQLWRKAPDEECRQQDQKLRDALQEARKKGLAVILLTHIPPFVSSVDEKEAYFNLPKAVRYEILRLCEDNGVIIWLAGHIHTTAERYYGSGMAILNAETTSVNFDDHPAGFRLLTMYPDHHFSWDFVSLEE
ncbi:MAG: metallophosphoesterase [Tannerellaceae bacterium]|jgi:Icc-related predicted phosphoesterase|nr:metallophosphoesterase [Tannerellaceae bacterium]